MSQYYTTYSVVVVVVDVDPDKISSSPLTSMCVYILFDVIVTIHMSYVYQNSVALSTRNEGRTEASFRPGNEKMMAVGAAHTGKKDRYD